MGILEMLALWAALFIVGEVLRPKPKLPNARPDSITPPSADEGSPIPVVFGTCKVSPLVAWMGDISMNEVSKKVSTGLFSSTRVVVAWQYNAGMMLPVCWGPVDELIDVYFGDYSTQEELNSGLDPNAVFAWTDAVGGLLSGSAYAPMPAPYSDGGAAVNIHMLDMFGGDTREGGVSGLIAFCFGSDTQQANVYLSQEWGAGNVSQYRGLCYAVLYKTYLGTSAYIKPISFVVRRCPNPLNLTGGAENISGDANGANIIYECLTNTLWGIGISDDQIDIASFVAAGDTLATEGLGVSIAITEQTTVHEVIQTVLSHIEGVIRQNAIDGKISLKLIRNDYVLANLPVLTPQNSRDLEHSKGSWLETINEIRLTYTDRAGRFRSTVVPAYNLANWQATREVVSHSVELRGLSNEGVAYTRAHQLLRASSVPIDKASLVAQRLASFISKGDPFVIDYPAKGLNTVVMRALKIDYGTLTDGAVKIDAIQDVWDVLDAPVPDSPDVPVEVCGYTDPEILAIDTNRQYPGFVEMKNVGHWLFFGGGNVRLLVGKVTRSNVDYDWYMEFYRNGGQFNPNDSGPYDPVGVLVDPYLMTTDYDDATGFTIIDQGGVAQMVIPSDTFFNSRLVNGVIFINDEIMAFDGITQIDGITFQVTGVKRGIFDTVPQDHPAGSTVWFALNAGINYLGYFNQILHWPRGEVMTGWIERPQGFFRQDLDPLLVTAQNSRSSPPSNVELNGQPYQSWPASLGGVDAVLTWFIRNQVEEYTANEVPYQDETTGSYTLNGTIRVEAVIDNVVVRTWDGLTGTTVTWTAAEIASDNPSGRPMTFRIIPVDGINGIDGNVRETPSFLA